MEGRVRGVVVRLNIGVLASNAIDDATQEDSSPAACGLCLFTLVLGSPLYSLDCI